MSCGLLGAALVVAAAACGDNLAASGDASRDGASDDATSDGAVDAPQVTGCGAAAGSTTIVAQGSLLGADETKVYVWSDGLWTWPKAGGIPAPYPYAAPSGKPRLFAAAGGWLYWASDLLVSAQEASSTTHTFTGSPDQFVFGLTVLSTGDAFVLWRCYFCSEPDRIDHIPPGATAAVPLWTGAAPWGVTTMTMNGSVLVWDEQLASVRRIYRRAATGEVTTLVELPAEVFETFLYAVTADELLISRPETPNSETSVLEQRALSDGSLVTSHPVPFLPTWVGATAGMAFVLRSPFCNLGSTSILRAKLDRISLDTGSTEAVVEPTLGLVQFGIADQDVIYFGEPDPTCCGAHGQSACHSTNGVLCHRP